MGDLHVECPIHLDVVSINDILVFKCGHGFCEPCLDEYIAHHAQSRLSCPTCRKPVRRNEAFPLFLTSAQPSTSTQSTSRPTVDAAYARLIRELSETKVAHANCSDRIDELQDEVDALRHDEARHMQAMQLQRGRNELLEERLAREAENATRVREESSRTREEMTRLQVENLKTSKALEEAQKDVQVQAERVKQFQGYVEQYKHKLSLEKKKRKAIESTNRELLSKREDDSLVVVDANSPDMLLHEPDFRWLDEACEVKGDRLCIPDDEELQLEEEKENEDQVPFIDPSVKGKQRENRHPGPSTHFSSDWYLGAETHTGPSSGTTRKRKQVGGSTIVKVKVPRKAVGDTGPLAFDSLGRVKGIVALGSRQKLNSKN